MYGVHKRTNRMLLSSDVQYVNVQYSKQGSSRLFLMQWTSLYCTLLEFGGHGDRLLVIIDLVYIDGLEAFYS